MKLKVAFLDAFHGDCAVITFDENGKQACIVIDGGQKKDAAKRLAAYLKSEKVEVIDLLVATHIDNDHIYGLVHFLKLHTGKVKDWNRGKEKCIRYYWGPKPDPAWVPPPKKKRTKTSSAARSHYQMLDFVIKGVKENQSLDKLIKKHVISTDNIHYPSLRDLPPNIFRNVELVLMAPDKQILDSEIQAKAMTITNSPYIRSLSTRKTRRKRPLTIRTLKRILAENAEAMAEIANRHANNQSIVFKLMPKVEGAAAPSPWSFLFSGDAEQESWEMMRLTAGVKDKLPSRVLKVPHHGSVNGIDKETFDIVNPEYNIISAGQKHGLPDGQILNLIKEDGNRKLFCTERNNKKGPCDSKECIRGKTADFRSLRFIIDTATQKGDVEIFTINPAGSINITTDQVWCRESNWPNK
jgi:beta-lactamase superfamily II metal-dependent hydrolase